MSIKPIVPDEYIVREMFGCGEGHVLPPGFTHWESGEACLYGHTPDASNEAVHLYWRLVLVPVHAHWDGSPACDSGPTCRHDMWEKLCASPNQWAHLPMAPSGMSEGDRLDTNVMHRLRSV